MLELLQRSRLCVQLNARCCSPRAYGIDERRWQELLPVMAGQALASGSPANNPRVPSASEIEDLYRQAWGCEQSWPSSVSTKRQLLFAKRRVRVISDNTGSSEDSLQTFLLSTGLCKGPE